MIEHKPLAETLAEALDNFDKTHEVVLTECGVEIKRFLTVLGAKQYLQNTWGEGQQLEWKRVEGRPRKLVHEQFAIFVVKKGTKL